jgi:hypothetical protein
MSPSELLRLPTWRGKIQGSSHHERVAGWFEELGSQTTYNLTHFELCADGIEWCICKMSKNAFEPKLDGTGGVEV